MSKMLLTLLLFLCSAAPCSISLADDFSPVLGPRPLTFPRDHGSHPEQEIEWWYYTGHLRTTEGEWFGFELTFFRIGVTPKPLSKSLWESPSVYRGHFTLTDDQNSRFLFSERMSRESLSQAGSSENELDVHIKDWRVTLKGDRLELHAEDEEKRLSLDLRSKKPVVMNGDRGYSQKGSAPGEASIYTSLTRLFGDGSLTVNGATHTIDSASVWMDHEAFTSPDVKGAHAWDWFALQLDSGEEVMVYLLKDESGAPTNFSSGTFVDREGHTERLSQRDFTVRSLDTWKSAGSGKSYPSGWRLELPGKGISVTVKPTVLNQEVRSNPTYWEGRSTISGSHKGDAYVELVGY